MKKPSLISKVIDDFYTETSEDSRLQLGLGPLEFERNKELISRFLPAKSCNVVDVGGGTGVYSEWLANAGHQVTMIEPVEKHIKIALKRAAKLKSPFKIIQGESGSLDLQDEIAEVVILHGPLYHLQKREVRIKSFSEAERVLKPGGIVLGFAINHTASTLPALLNGITHENEFYKMCIKEITTGIHQAPPGNAGVLPEAYYHKPKDLREELRDAGFEYLNTFAVEGMIWLDKNYFLTRGDEKKKEPIMELLRLTESKEELLAFSPHLMIAGRKK